MNVCWFPSSLIPPRRLLMQVGMMRSKMTTQTLRPSPLIWLGLTFQPCLELLIHFMLPPSSFFFPLIACMSACPFHPQHPPRFCRYVINVRQIAKFVVGLLPKVSPTDIEEGMRVGVDRTKYFIQVPLLAVYGILFGVKLGFQVIDLIMYST